MRKGPNYIIFYLETGNLFENIKIDDTTVLYVIHNLFITQRYDGVQFGGLISGVESGCQPYEKANKDP